MAQITIGGDVLFAEFWEEWSQLLPDYNWRTFQLVTVELEDDRMMGGVEATVVLLGFGVRMRWNYRETETMRRLRDAAEKIKRQQGSPDG